MAAELAQPPTPDSPPALTNFAPLEPLLRLKRGGFKPASYLQKAIQELFQDLHRRDSLPWREINNVGQLVALFLDGKQFLARNPFDGSWGVLPISPATMDDRRPLNILNNIKQNLLTKWENSNPDIVIRAARNISRAYSAAKSADAINNYYERQFYYPHFTQQECLMGLTFGTYIDRYRYDDAKVSMSVIQDIFETKEASFGEGYGFCADCQYGGKAQEFANQQCPHCQSTAIDVSEPSKGPLASATGQRKHQLGDLVCELLPLSGCRYDLAKRPEDSSWLIYRQEVPRNDVTRILGNVLIPEGNVDHDLGLEVLRGLHKQGQPWMGRGASGNRRDEDHTKDTVVFEEMWVSPSEYAHINLIGGEKTVDGVEVPKGRLIDFFPDGFCAVGLNGMSVVLALYPEKHRDHIVSGTWFIRAQSGVGRGLVDSVEVQKLFNTTNNQALQYMTSTYTPAVGYDSQIWSGNKMKYLGTPRTNIPFDLTKLPEGRKLHDSIYQFQPTAMPNQFFNFAQNFLSVLFQRTSMVTDYNQGEPGITSANTTATAAEIDQSNADAINQPIFKIKADARRRGAELTIKLFRKHFPLPRYFDLGGRHGRQQGIELSAADVDCDLVFEIARNSEMPKGPFQRQKNRAQFMNAMGGGAGLAALQETAPDTVAAMQRDYDVDMDIDTSDAVNDLCLKRLHQMEEALRANGGEADPRVLIQSIQPPISAVERTLKETSEWFADWLSTDDGQEAPMPLRAAAELLAQGMFSGAIEQESIVAAGRGTVEAAMMAPSAMGQAALDQQGEGESTEPDPTASLQAEQELAVQERELADNEAQRSHEKDMLRLEGERDAKVSKADADNKIRIEKSKPKVKPAAKTGARKK